MAAWDEVVWVNSQGYMDQMAGNWCMFDCYCEERARPCSAEFHQSLNNNVSVCSVHACVCLSGLQEPVYQRWLTMDLWLWKWEPLKYEWRNPHPFPGNRAEPWRWTSANVCLRVRTPVQAHARAARLPSFTCSDTLSWSKAALSFVSSTRHSLSRRTALEQHGPQCWTASLSYSTEIYAWKLGRVGSSETCWSWKWRLGHRSFS